MIAWVNAKIVNGCRQGSLLASQLYCRAAKQHSQKFYSIVLWNQNQQNKKKQYGNLVARSRGINHPWVERCQQ
uniref:hypothetical protein n=1 Tax=Hassallia byssoidea TaxID=482630 RepID=UPI001F40ECCC|nr:hypothetical protein [Hassalia byssoidea]